MDTTTTLDPYGFYSNAKVRHCQVVFLNYKKEKIEKIAEIVDYAVSTVRGYISKYSNLLDIAKQLFGEVAIKAKNTIESIKKDMCKKVIKKDTTSHSTAIDARVCSDNQNEVDKYYHSKPYGGYTYCVSFYCPSTDERFFKVGMTTRNPNQRMKEKMEQVGNATGIHRWYWQYHIDALYFSKDSHTACYLEDVLREAYYSLNDTKLVGNDSMVDVSFRDIDITKDETILKAQKYVGAELKLF